MLDVKHDRDDDAVTDLAASYDSPPSPTRRSVLRRATGLLAGGVTAVALSLAGADKALAATKYTRTGANCRSSPYATAGITAFLPCKTYLNVGGGVSGGLAYGCDPGGSTTWYYAGNYACYVSATVVSNNNLSCC